MQSSSATASGEVHPGESAIDELLDPAQITEVLTQFKTGKFVLPTLKKVMDAILIQVALEINYSSIHPYYIFSKGIRSQDNPLTEEDMLAGGCCFPNMDCVGSAYFIRHKILTTLKTFDEESTFQIYVFANDSCLKIRKSNGCSVSLLIPCG